MFRIVTLEDKIGQMKDETVISRTIQDTFEESIGENVFVIYE